MRNKKVLYILFAINIALFINISNVLGADITLDAGETSLNANAGTGGGAKTNTLIAYGYRVSFVDPKNGNKTVGHSVDYWGQGDMISDNACSIDGYICDSSKFDWDFISAYSTYQDYKKTPITYRYFDHKYNKTEAINEKAKDHSGKYSLKYANNDFLIPKYRDYLVNKTGCSNLAITKDQPRAILISAQTGDSCYDNNYVKFAYEALKNAASKLDYDSYARLIKDAEIVNTTGKSSTEIVSAAQNYIMIVEPLTAIRTNDSGSRTLGNPIYIGTMYELYKMGAIEAVGGGWVYDRYSYINAKIYNKQAVGCVAACSDGTTGGKIANLDQNKCSGVFTVKIADLFPCTSTVKSLYQSYKNKNISASDYDSGVQKQCTASGLGSCDWLKIGDEKDPSYAKYGVDPGSIASCNKPGCNAVAKANSTKLKSATAMRSYLTGLGYTIPSLANLDGYYSSPKLVDDNSQLCASTACSTLLNSIKSSKSNVNSKIDALNKLTNGKYVLLNRTVLEETGYEAQCDDIEACTVSPITPSCDTTNSTFTFRDAEKTSENVNCDFTKIAYNKKIGSEVVSNSVQTSVDKDYGKKAYCRETVTFNFPTDASKTTGGTIMKWGTNSSKLNDVFGTMTVTRKCYSIGDSSDTGFVINSNWANVIGGPLDTKGTGRIKPLVEMNYKEAIQDEKNATVISKTYLDTNLSRFEMIIHGAKGATDKSISYYDKAGNMLTTNSVTFKNDKNKTKYREFTCGSDCGSIEYVEMIADYNLTYPDSLKWYSDSQDNFKKKSAKDVEKKGVAEAKYVALGYGLPTTFLTPSSFNTVYGLSNDKTSGYMYVNLSNVGTKNRDGSYHFDRYTQYYIDDAYKSEYDTYKKTIKYSCNFSIENILYDYECPNKDCGKKESTCQEINGKQVCGTNRVPSDIDVVFRTVELISDSKDINQAFPGRSGAGRNIGLNWQFDENYKIATNILNDKIYDEEPKYEIDLTSSLIQKIRKSNSKNSYTSLDNYTFIKNSVSIDNKAKTDVENLCINGDKTACRSYSYYLKKNSEYSKALDSDIDYSYIYAASDFISDYAQDGTLKGTCVSEKDTKKRAEAYSKTFGC